MLKNLKKFFLVFPLFLVLLISSLFSPHLAISAEKAENATISDLVYADLAVSGNLSKVSVNYFDGNTSNNITINSDKLWIPASTIKLYAAMYAYDQVARGKISLDDQVVIDAKNTAPSEQVDNPLPDLTVGETVTVNELIQHMIEQSDNTAFNTLLDVLDRREITKYIHDLGLINSNIGAKLNLDDSQQQYENQVPGYGGNTTTSNDYATAFILINGNRIPGSDGLFNILSQQKINNMIPLLLPKGTVVAHKTGDLSPLFHDGGIVVGGDKRYVLSIFSNTGDPNVVAHISDLVYTGDSSLVGSNLKGTPTSDEEWPVDQPLDPLVADAGSDENKTVLAAVAPPNNNLSAIPITAADLGIKPSDISLTISPSNLPPVVIPADSPFHFFVTFWENITVPLIIGRQSQVAFETQNLKQQLAEAADLSRKGKHTESQTVLSDVDKRLAEIAKDPVVAASQNLQTNIQQVSETRFSLFTNELTSVSGDKRIAVIKEIANQAKNTAEKVQPFVPQAVTATNIAQKPLVGQVVNSNSSAITVKTPAGDLVTVASPTNIKIRDQKEETATTAPVSSIPVGETVALVGTSNNGNFTPIFAMTKLPQRYSAPLPATVVKVNEKNKTIVVTENGQATQIDVSQNTTIKSTDTTVDFHDIKPGDQILVHGEDVSSATNSASPVTTSTPIASTLPSLPGATPGPKATSVPGTGKTNTTQAPKANVPQTPATPQVIKAVLIQVSGQNNLKPPSSKKEEPKAPAKKEEKATQAPATTAPKK